MKLLIKKSDDNGRLARIPELLTTKWAIEVADERDRGAFSAALATADAIVSMDWPAAMPPAPQLKLLHLPGAGTDAIEFDAVPETAAVCNVFEHEIGIAEYVLATMLQWVVPLPELERSIRSGRWHGSHMFGPLHAELYGKTLGIVGYGRIGREVARRARAFGMNIIACGRKGQSGDNLVDAIMSITELEKLLGQSDFILISLPLTTATRAIIGAQQFAAMKPDAVIINVARGQLIEEEALFEACKGRRIGGAIIDTWYRYPASSDEVCAPSRFPFHELDNVIMTPHASAWSDQIIPRRNKVIADNLDRLASGRPLRNVVREAVR